MSFVFDNLKVLGKKHILWQTKNETWSNSGYYQTDGKWGGSNTLVSDSESSGSFVFDGNNINTK